MSTRTPRTAAKAMKSVVIVTNREHGGDYCSGFVAVKSRTDAGCSPKTLVVAPSAFVRGNQHLNVCFFDGVRSPASVVAEEGPFTLLRTAAHSGSEAVRLLEESEPSPFHPRRTFMVPPISRRKTYYQPTYATLESLESYVDDCSVLSDSRNYFLVSCDYSEMTNYGSTRLAASPVFIINNGITKDSGSTMGLVLQVAHIGNDLMKVAVTSTYFKTVLNKLDPPSLPPPPPRKPRKQGRLFGGKPPLLSVPQKGGRGGQKPGRGGSCGQKRKRVN